MVPSECFFESPKLWLLSLRGGALWVSGLLVLKYHDSFLEPPLAHETTRQVPVDSNSDFPQTPSHLFSSDKNRPGELQSLGIVLGDRLNQLYILEVTGN